MEVGLRLLALSGRSFGVAGNYVSEGLLSSSGFFSTVGATFLRRVRVLFGAAAMVGATLAPALRLSSSVERVEGLICPRVARAATCPSFVEGM